MHPMQTIAVRAARAAGQIIARAYNNSNKITIEGKGTNDFVTNVDKEAEDAIRAQILKSYPDHTIIGEENGKIEGNDSESKYVWIVDPLDGTYNFIRGIPHFSVSIALQVSGITEVAVVYNPIIDELFTAIRGKGAQCNEFKLRVTNPSDLNGTLLATGFPFKNKKDAPLHLNILQESLEKCLDIRRTGSAALDLAYVAAGRFDGYFELGLKPWDIAAGALICREAGGIVTDFTGGHDFLATGSIIAGSAKVTANLVKIALTNQ